MDYCSPNEENEEEGVALQGTEMTSILDIELAPQASNELEPAFFTSGESFDSGDVDSDDESSIMPPPTDVEESSISNHPRNDSPYGYSMHTSVLPVSVQPPEIELPPEPSTSQDAGSEKEIEVARMGPPLPRRDGSDGSINLEKSNSRFKMKINSRLSHAVKGVDFAELWRSPDLIPLTRNYQVFRKQLRRLIASIKAYKKTTEQMGDARSKLYGEFFVMSENTPLYDHVGKFVEPSLQLIDTDSKGFPDTVDCMEPMSGQPLEDELRALSLASVHHLALMNQKKCSEEYEEFILAYALQWEEIVTSRLDNEIKNVQQLQRKRFHYEKKVSGLRRRTNRIQAKGKEVPAAVTERSQRNEQKLSDAFQSHERSASQLCVLLEEATENGWKDLRYEINRISRDEESYGRLKSTLAAMKKKSFSPTTSPANSEMKA